MNTDLQIAEEFLRNNIPSLGLLEACAALAFALPSMAIEDITDLARLIGY